VLIALINLNLKKLNPVKVPVCILLDLFSRLIFSSFQELDVNKKFPERFSRISKLFHKKKEKLKKILHKKI
jgi:hypothetical protein